MNTTHSLLLQMGTQGEEHTPSAKDLEDYFGFVCLETNEFPSPTELKEITTTSWHDEDGEDIYVPSEMRFAAFDWKVEVATSGSVGTTKQRLDNLVLWLTGKGGEPLPDSGDGLTIWSAFYQAGFKNCYLKELADVSFDYCGNYEILTCSLVFRVCDPITKISVSGSHDNSTLTPA